MNAALKLTCAAFGVCAGVWLAGSAYFLVGSRDAAPVEFPARQELAPEENAFSLFKDLDLHRQRQTNFNFSVAYRYIRGMTNGPVVVAEMDALVAAHSNLIATVSKILACRGVQVPAGEPRGEIGRIGINAVMPLLRVKAFREAERGETAAAHATIDMMLDFAQFLAASKSLLGYWIGLKNYANMAFEVGSERPVADDRDQSWLTHLMRRAETLEGQSKFWCSQASAEGLTDVIDYLKMKGTRRVASLIRGHLASFPSREKVLRKPRPFDEYVEWEEVRVRCCTSLLLLFAGYADYSFQPNTTGRYYLEEEKIFQAKLAEPAFDRAYAVSASNGRRLAQPFRPNWYGHEFVGQSHEHYWVDAYTRYYESLFNLRARRVLLACKVYRGQKGHLPARLEELVPAILPAVPLDPYDGKPLRYEPKPGYIWTPGKKGDFDGKVRYNRNGQLINPLPVRRSVRWIDAVREP